MSNTIPLSKDFNVTTNTVSPAGTAIYANGLMLTTNESVTPGKLSYAYQLSDVTAAYGAGSDEETCASVYFNGFVNAGVLPGTLLICGIPVQPTSGSLSSASMAAVSMATINQLAAGTITVSIDGVSQTSSTIDLSAATSQSNVASLLQASLTGATVAWNSVSSKFVISSSTTGAASSVGYAAAGAIATGLKLTQAAGATISSGVDEMTLTELMDSIVNQSQNWASFAAAQELTTSQKTELAAWTNSQNNRYTYAVNDSSADAITTNSTTAFYPSVVVANGYSGIAGIYGAPEYAFMVPAYYACLDFSATNGRVTFKFRQFSGLAANVTDLATANALESNGYSYYGSYSQNAVLATYASPGNISGSFEWLDSYINQVVIKANLVSAFAALFLNNQSYAFNATGYASVQAATIDVATSAINYGAIQKGVTLDTSQTAIIKNVVGKDITQQLFSDGWYLYIPVQTGANRLARDLKGCVFYYVDGQMIQSIDLTSTAVL